MEDLRDKIKEEVKKTSGIDLSIMSRAFVNSSKEDLELTEKIVTEFKYIFKHQGIEGAKEYLERQKNELYNSIR